MTTTTVPAAQPRHRPTVRAVARGVTRWLLSPLLTVVASSFVIFAGLSATPGDPALRLLGSHPSAAQIAAENRLLGLDRPLPARYWTWLTGAVHGGFGQSLLYRTGVGSLLTPRIGTTLLLVAMAGVLLIVGGLLLGIAGATLRPAATVVTILTSVGIAVPAFVASVLLISVFALWLGWLPAVGQGSGTLDTLRHLVLPAIALAIGYGAYVAQVVRSALSEEQDSEHAETARGRGIPAPSVFRRHVLRNAAGPIVTVSGISLAALVAGAAVVESAFGLNGLGSFLVTSVENKDYPVVEAISLLMVLVFVLVNTAVDTITTLLDPRLRERARS